MTEKVIRLVNQQIRFDLSPEQVSGWLLKQTAYASDLSTYLGR
jgi:IS30 family transposase